MNKNTEELIKMARKPNQTDVVSLMLMRKLIDMPTIECLIDYNIQSLIDNNASVYNAMQDNNGATHKTTHVSDAMRGAVRSWAIECKIKSIHNDE